MSPQPLSPTGPSAINTASKPLTLVEAQAALLRATAQTAELTRRVAELQQQDDSGVNWRTAAKATSDEHVAVARLSGDRLVNLSRDYYDAHRREVHLSGRSYEHIGETPDGKWIYRHV